MRLFLAVAICSLTAFFHSGPGFAQDPAKDLDKMQGAWKMESARDRGEGFPAEVLARLTMTIKGNQLIPSDNPKDLLTITLDPSKKPAAIDLKEKDKVNLGIYEIKDDTLQVCFTEGGDRPKEFLSTKENKAILLVMKRVVKKQ